MNLKARIAFDLEAVAGATVYVDRIWWSKGGKEGWATFYPFESVLLAKGRAAKSCVSAQVPRKAPAGWVSVDYLIDDAPEEVERLSDAQMRVEGPSYHPTEPAVYPNWWDAALREKSAVAKVKADEAKKRARAKTKKAPARKKVTA